MAFHAAHRQQQHISFYRRQDAMRQALEHAPVYQTNSDALIDSLMSLSLDLPPQVPFEPLSILSRS
jgi:hypothetical protein